MRITDIIVEGDIGDVADLSAGNVKSGYDAVNKLFSPSKWFSGNVKTDTDNPKTPKTRVVRTSHLDRESLVRASQGAELFRDDLNRLKLLFQKVQAGKIRSNDPDQLAQALRTAYKGQRLSSEQQALLAQLAKDL